MTIRILLSALITVSVLLTSMHSAPAYAAKYYKCDPGYTMQQKNGAVRCFKSSSVKAQNPKKCISVRIPAINKSVGHFFRKNWQGNADKCVGTYKIGPMQHTSALDLACSPGYNLKVKSGNDRCEKTVPAEIRKPNKQVNI